MKTPQQWFDFHHKTHLVTPGDPPWMVTLARLIQEDALEAAAKACESDVTQPPGSWHAGYDQACRNMAEKIRELIPKKPGIGSSK